MTAALAAQASLLLVAAAVPAGRYARRWADRHRTDRMWTKGLAAVHADHFATVEQVIPGLLSEVRAARAAGARRVPAEVAA